MNTLPRQLTPVSPSATSEVHSALDKASPSGDVGKHDWSSEDVTTLGQQKPASLGQLRCMNPPIARITLSHSKVEAHGLKPSHGTRRCLGTSDMRSVKA